MSVATAIMMIGLSAFSLLLSGILSLFVLRIGYASKTRWRKTFELCYGLILIWAGFVAIERAYEVFYDHRLATIITVHQSVIRTVFSFLIIPMWLDTRATYGKPKEK